MNSKESLDQAGFTAKLALIFITFVCLWPSRRPLDRSGYVVWLVLLAAGTIWIEWSRARRSPRRGRALLCGLIGHSLPRRTVVDEDGKTRSIDVACRRCDRVFQAPRFCEKCRRIMNDEEV